MTKSLGKGGGQGAGGGGQGAGSGEQGAGGWGQWAGGRIRFDSQSGRHPVIGIRYSVIGIRYSVFVFGIEKEKNIIKIISPCCLTDNYYLCPLFIGGGNRHPALTA